MIKMINFQQFDHFISHLSGLTSLKLKNLLLSPSETMNFMENALNSRFSGKLEKLTILNLTNGHCATLSIGLFLNLKLLTVSPQHLNEDTLLLIGQLRKIQHLTLIQDENTFGAVSLDFRAWKQLTNEAQNLTVTLKCAGDRKMMICIKKEYFRTTF